MILYNKDMAKSRWVINRLASSNAHCGMSDAQVDEYYEDKRVATLFKKFNRLEYYDDNGIWQKSLYEKWSKLPYDSYRQNHQYLDF